MATEARARLASRFGSREAAWMVRMIFEDVKGYSQVDMALNGDRDLGEATCKRVNEIVDRLLANEPLQYILGHARFYGMDFKVSPAVLIPRPETEELVDIIVKDADGREDLRVLDLGTGSGCIAIALARNLPFAAVTGIDISADALDVARANAATLKARVDFNRVDILDLHLEPASLDIIVSNPPYITRSERSAMESNVLDHEPATALFVPDDDPLKFYTPIYKAAMNALTPGGRLYFELNPLTADALADRMRADGWENVTIIPDSRKQKRFLSATRPR